MGLPTIGKEHKLPSDLALFYMLCGGATLFEHASFPFAIVPPKDFALANRALLKGMNNEMMVEAKDHTSWSWYIIATDGDLEIVSIDLDEQRLGQCYDCFWDVYPHDSELIAASFTDLLKRLLTNRGQQAAVHLKNLLVEI